MSELKGFFRIQIRKEALKFSAAHMTVFADGSKENLHGHNYRTSVEIEFEHFSLPEMIPFSDVKSEMRKICQEWDEKILLPSQCPFIKLNEIEDNGLEVLACGKRYLFPRDEVVLFSADNITSESLAKTFSERLVGSLSTSALARAGVRSIETKIEEITGQGASYVIVF